MYNKIGYPARCIPFVNVTCPPVQAMLRAISSSLRGRSSETTSHLPPVTRAASYEFTRGEFRGCTYSGSWTQVRHLEFFHHNHFLLYFVFNQCCRSVIFYRIRDFWPSIASIKKYAFKFLYKTFNNTPPSSLERKKTKNLSILKDLYLILPSVNVGKKKENRA